MKTQSDSFRNMARAREMREETERVESGFLMLRPLLLALGIDVGELDDIMAKMGKKSQELEDMHDANDQFNRRFGHVGLILYDSLDPKVARQANGAAEDGDFGEAERILVAYYDRQTIERHLRRMSVISAFAPRMRLANLALEDHVAERYHASILLILALADGLVLELTRQSVFSMDLSQDSSLAGHRSGLPALRKKLGRSRKATTLKELSLPFRHGIMHGRDLNYDNVTVSAKSWGFLFAVGDWAIRKTMPQLP